MRKLLIILTAFYLIPSVTNAQLWKLRRFELSGGIGTTQFFGDIGGYSNDKNILGLRDFTFLNTRMNINAGVKYRITDDISAKVNFAFGLFHSTDARGSHIIRGFEESALFFEPSLTAQYYFIKDRRDNSRLFLTGEKEIIRSIFHSLDFYVFTGFGGLLFNVTPNDSLSVNTTQTHGFTGVVPLGLGINMVYSERFNFAVEFGGRLTFSDYIDGYTSNRSRANDIYHMVNLMVVYKINTGRRKGAKA
jgi:hypothetical protein